MAGQAQSQTQSLEIEIVAKALKELGHATRLAIFRYLVKAGHQGVAVGELQTELAIPGSTLSHHLNSLMSAELLHQRREGRTLYCVANYQHLSAVIGFLEDECCRDEQCDRDPNQLACQSMAKKTDLQ